MNQPPEKYVDPVTLLPFVERSASGWRAVVQIIDGSGRVDTARSGGDWMSASDALAEALQVAAGLRVRFGVVPEERAWAEKLAIEWTGKATQWLADYRAWGESEDSGGIMAARERLVCAANLVERAREP